MPVKRFSVIPITDHIDNWRMFGEMPGHENTLAAGVRRNVIDFGLTTFESEEAANPHESRVTDERDGKARREPFIDGDRGALCEHLRSAVRENAGRGPIVLFVHGFQFDPRAYRKQAAGNSVNPHIQLYRFAELEPQDGLEAGLREHLTHATPWLGRASNGDDFPGLAVCFGYESWGDEYDVSQQHQGLASRKAFLSFDFARGTPRNLYAQAYFNSKLAALFLAEVIAAINVVMTEESVRTPVHLFAHSLGTRVALYALETLATKDKRSSLDRVKRVLLLAGAALQIEATAAMERIGSTGHKPEFINVLSPSDQIVRILGSRAAGKTASRDRMLNRPWTERYRNFLLGWETLGIEGANPGAKSTYGKWVDIDLTSKTTLNWGKERGMDLLGSLRTSRWFAWDLLSSYINDAEIWDHWVHYTHPGNWELYRALLFESAPLPLDDLPKN